MELLQLKYFLALAGNQHVTKTAEHLHIAQPALTQTIHRLEKELGVKLFRPSGRNITLTSEGRYLQEKLAPIIKALEEVPEEIRELSDKRNKTLRINVLAASTLVTREIIRYQKRHEGVSFRIVQNTETENADITIFTTDMFQKPQRLQENYYVFREDVLLAVPKPSAYSDQKSVRLKDVAKQDFIALAGSRSLRMICDKFCLTAGFQPQVVFESDSPEAVKNLIGASMGVGFWPQYTWGQPDMTHMAVLPIEEPKCCRDIVIQIHEHCENMELARDFFGFLSRCFEAAKLSII